MSPESRPVSVTPAPKIQTRNKIHVGTSDKARSCPRTARKRIRLAPVAPMKTNERRAKRRREPRIDDGDCDERELREQPHRNEHAHEAMPQSEPQERMQKHDEARRKRAFRRCTIDGVRFGLHVEELMEEANSTQR